MAFQLSGPTDINSTLVNCICATNPNCEDPVTIYYDDFINDEYFDPDIAYVVPGSTDGCSPIDSLQLSTLECFYSDSDCFSIVMNFIQQTYIANNIDSLWFNPRPLIYDPTLSRFPPNTSIKMILQNMMIERWNISTSYNSFYESCAPSYCTYSQTIHTKTVIGVIVTLISMIGGLVVSLRLITPQFMKFSIYLWTIISKRQRQQQQQQGNC